MAVNAAFQPFYDEYYANNPNYPGHQFANDVRYQDPEFRKKQAARYFNDVEPPLAPFEAYWILKHCDKEVKELHAQYLLDLRAQNWNNLSSFDRCLFRIEDCVGRVLSSILGNAPPSHPPIGRCNKYLLIGGLLAAASVTTFFLSGQTALGVLVIMTVALAILCHKIYSTYHQN